MPTGIDRFEQADKETLQGRNKPTNAELTSSSFWLRTQSKRTHQKRFTRQPRLHEIALESCSHVSKIVVWCAIGVSTGQLPRGRKCKKHSMHFESLGLQQTDLEKKDPMSGGRV
jgi:hypothetical protein